MRQKETLKKILVVMSIILAFLPFLVTFSGVLTNIFLNFKWYVWMQEKIVPYEAGIISLILKWIGINSDVIASQHVVIMLKKQSGEIWPAVMQWNCLGWQSLVFLSLSLPLGLKGNFSVLSKIETIILGVTGTFLVNIIRILIIILLIYFANDFAVYIVHDYFAMGISLLWFLFYWWFSYSYILVSGVKDDGTSERKC